MTVWAGGWRPNWRLGGLGGGGGVGGVDKALASGSVPWRFVFVAVSAVHVHTVPSRVRFLAVRFRFAVRFAARLSCYSNYKGTYIRLI